MLDGRALSATYLAQKVNKAAAVLRSLEKKGFVESEDVAAERDPLRASAARLRVEFVARATEKIPKPERELLAYLELHPGQHNLAALEDTLPKASTAARALARRQLARLALEPVSSLRCPAPRAAHAESAPAGGVRCHSSRARLAPVSGVSARRRDRIGQDGSVPERDRSGPGAGPRRAAAGPRDRADTRGGRAVSPPVRRAGGDSALRVSRFRTRPGVAQDPRGPGVGGGRHAIRRIRAGAEPGPDHRRRRTRPELQAAGNAALSRPRRGRRAGPQRKRGDRAGFGHAQSGNPLQRRARQVHAPGSARTHRAPPDAAAFR